VPPSVARRIAEHADGRPGLALALVAGLDDDERRGVRAVTTATRPVGAVVDALDARLRSGGDAVVRALIVAALDRSGEAGVVLRALELLGEDGTGFERAEELGWVRRIDGRVVISDPWVRAVAAHLVAAPSRRAAHRALAAALDRPDDALMRALHLADGVDVLDDDAAATLDLVASDAARRGSPASAARLAERAAAIANSTPVRRAASMRALGWWLDAADVDGVRRTRSALEALVDRGDRGDRDAASMGAIDAATWFLDGVRTLDATDRELVGQPGHDVDGGSAARVQSATRRGDDHRVGTPEAWRARRWRRDAIERALADGRHGPIGRGDPAGLLAGLDEASRAFHLARALRRSGALREARTNAHLAAALWGRTDHADARRLALLVAELDLLSGRIEDAAASIAAACAGHHATGGLPAEFASELDDIARRLLARSTLISRPDAALAVAVDAWSVVHGGVQGEIEHLVRSAVLADDVAGLVGAADTADAHELPVEAAEARLFAASLAGGDARRDLIARAGQQLARCGVRCWDARLASLASAGRTPPAVTPGDVLGLLTPAELRVAEAVGAGMTNRDVAAQLFLSVKTVDFHLQQIYRKLGVRSRTELAVRLARPPADLPARGATV
jgi:DNA-binding CsgD family transcriptional regulator